jgi:ribonuclease HI
MEIHIYTDGAATGNPGPGGYGAVLLSGNLRKELSQGYQHTTNNRMELLAVIAALESLKKPNSSVVVFSDSKYVVDAIEKKWLAGWVQKNFNKVKNPDLWKRFLVVFKRHQVKFVWVKGHADNAENNRCDFLATEAAKGPNYLVDYGYENSLKEEGLF